MGNVTLSRVDSASLSGNAFVQRFVSPEHLDANDPFWTQMLQFQMRTPKSAAQWKSFEHEAKDILKRFAANNVKSGNLGQLVRVLEARKRELKTATETESSSFLWQTFNALFLLKVCIKHLVEAVKEEELIRQIETVGIAQQVSIDEKAASEALDNGVLSRGEAASVETLVECLIDIIAELPLR